MKTSNIITTFLSLFTIINYLHATELTFIGDINYPADKQFNGTTINGLSGLVYDHNKKLLYVISDDKGDNGASRYYQFKIELNRTSFKLSPYKVIILKNRKGGPFKEGITDFEGITILKNGNLLLSSELINTGIYEYKLDGTFIKEWYLPPKFHHTKRAGTAKFVNHSLESLTATPDKNYIFSANEQALIPDGEVTTIKKGSFVRLIKYNNGKFISTFAYPLSPIPNPTGLKTIDPRSDNGLVDLLAIDQTKLLALERSFIYDTNKVVIKIFQIEILPTTTDISKLKTLKNKKFTPVKKKLILDLDTIIPKMNKKYQKLDNIEGICYGPTLKNGDKTIILVSDGNFNKNQRTLFLAFRIKGTESTR